MYLDSMFRHCKLILIILRTCQLRNNFFAKLNTPFFNVKIVKCCKKDSHDICDGPKRVSTQRFLISSLVIRMTCCLKAKMLF